MVAAVSLMGIYNYQPDIFDLFQLPDAMDEMYRNIIIEQLLIDTANMEVLYPEPATLRRAIGVWSDRRCRVWAELYETTQYKYNPIENYDRNETWEDNNSRKISGESKTNTGASGTIVSQLTGTRKNEIKSTNSTQNSSTDVFSRTAYNSESWADAEKHAVSGNTSGSDSRTETAQNTDENSIESSDSSTNTATNSNNDIFAGTKTGRVHGNIGVTTTQQMISAQRDVVNYDVVQIIIDEFIRKFIIMIY